MRQLMVKFDTPAFQAELKRSAEAKVPLIDQNEFVRLTSTAFVLIGERTAAYGGGLSGIGYIMQNGKATHSVGVSAVEVQQRIIRR